ncbi:hypothetical protein [Dinghuibacter silviterrae]|uniref:Uncharacterized protein n=1 Tax=Dinghuibacter silviterrae TaxID=1539049 RepID=A0A4V3GKQ2_9BACT|nr:hypothetical protein [Dinghuibacter silviterrae]TDW96472.1 hypothetical protein EDB95_4303 [Dinghuibacter silviterrae]
MKTLSETWFAEGYIDFELKKYTLLAYLQEVNRCFDENKLYPQLSDIIFHYNNLCAFRENKQILQKFFPKRLSKIDLERLQLLYERMVEDEDIMLQLEEIIQFAIGRLTPTIRNGTDLYEFVEERLSITPVGLIPLDVQEGYMFLSNGSTRQTRVYQYRLSIFEKHDEKYRAIKTEYIETRRRSIVYTYEQIKAELLRSRATLPNPAVYSVETELTYPLEETLLPIAKRRLVRYLTTAA